MKHHYWEAPIVIYLFLGRASAAASSSLSALFDLDHCSGLRLAVLRSGVLCPGGAGPRLLLPRLRAGTAAGVLARVHHQDRHHRVGRGAPVRCHDLLASCGGPATCTCSVGSGPSVWPPPFEGVRPIMLGVAGVAGFGIMVYTGVMLSTLKAHAFWATPALPVLFTVSALSTACAGYRAVAGRGRGRERDRCGGGRDHPRDRAHRRHRARRGRDHRAAHHGLELLRRRQRVRPRGGRPLGARQDGAPVLGRHGFRRTGSAPGALRLGRRLHWPEVLAPILVLCGGLLLRYLCVYSDERAPLPGEERFTSAFRRATPSSSRPGRRARTFTRPPLD